MSLRKRWGWCFGVVGCLVVSANTAAAVQPESRAERLRFDARRSEWVEVAPPVPGTAEGDLAIVRTRLTDGEYKRAHREIKAWFKRYGEMDRQHAAALLLHARIEKALRNYYVAYEILEQFLDSYGGTEPAGDAAVEMFNVAEVFLSGVRRKFWGMRILPADEFALDILDELTAEFPNTTIAEQAVKTKADYYYAQGEFSLAEMEYARFRQLFPTSRYTRYALRRGADAALASFGGVHFDDAPLVEAEERYRQYAAMYPGLAEQEGVGQILQSIRERRADKEFDIGEYYQRTGHDQAATFYFRSTMTHWPDTIAATQAAAVLGLPSGSGWSTAVETNSAEPKGSSNP